MQDSDLEKTQQGLDAFQIFVEQFGNDIYTNVVLEELFAILMKVDNNGEK